ncbi:hypothetical protein FHS51_001352 [Sphingobium wenxiniae]|uniref:Uncharacterized protein n=2 Tax=Sphingobium TaxID=165695 RepID=T0GA72_9SPHN|nr:MULTISPECIES: hypothetical protein [Sphingobium]EQA96907.1 hypothetical protein L485_22775 [Sphingobium baderi LL03]KMS64066.1 hypothetical protein V475_20025 [Sphingobium baderi LL03]MBB6191130.1 hypothetical protein [Sphingobium wenxiniae]TWH96070.1 hypothetical protein IQ35_01159 [Sphingobium wenxiniae]WRD77943.1 hypothetical protein QQ987_07540 [Sphingobium baderi]
MEQRPLIERLARHLSAGHPDRWANRVEDAASILAILKEPDCIMMEAGSGDIWRSMIEAALRQRWEMAAAEERSLPPAGADEEGEIPLSEKTVGGDPADWIHLRESREKKS